MPHQPTRLPYGLSFVKPGANTNEYVIGTSATPNVAFGTYFLANASNPTITNFTGGENGKVIFLRCSTGSVVLIGNSAGGIRGNNIVIATSGGAQNIFTLSATGGDITMLNGETLGFFHNGTDWSLIGSRVAISTQI
mgnify:CR=1 FL=1